MKLGGLFFVGDSNRITQTFHEVPMGQVFKTQRRVEFRDTDTAGIVHFSNFFAYMEQAEHALLRSIDLGVICDCLLYTSPSPRDGLLSRMPSSA